MKTNKCIAIVLAGGRGKRLGALTQYYSKPAIHFGGNNRLVDFALCNCRHAGFQSVAVLSQYYNTDLNEYIRSAYEDRAGNMHVQLIASKSEQGAYKGTADAVFRNIEQLDKLMPDNVLILASDHVYKMDFHELLDFHKSKQADVTLASVPVTSEDAGGLGIVDLGEGGRVFSFEEKPRKPKSNLASMGIYVFKWELLKQYLKTDHSRDWSSHDFARDILPDLLYGNRVFSYEFQGYWRDVGTVDKLWEANMEQLENPCIKLPDRGVITGKTTIFGHVKHSVLSDFVSVGRGAEVIDSVIMPNVFIGNGVKIVNTIVGSHTVIRDGAVIGEEYGESCFVDKRVCGNDVSLVSPWADIQEGTRIQKSSHVTKDLLMSYYTERKKTCLYAKTTDFAVV